METVSDIRTEQGGQLVLTHSLIISTNSIFYPVDQFIDFSWIASNVMAKDRPSWRPMHKRVWCFNRGLFHGHNDIYKSPSKPARIMFGQGVVWLTVVYFAGHDTKVAEKELWGAVFIKNQ